jgi:hypothetical protein
MTIGAICTLHKKESNDYTMLLRNKMHRRKGKGKGKVIPVLFRQSQKYNCFILRTVKTQRWV